MKKLASLFFALFMLFPLCINAQDKDIRIDFFDAEFFFIEEEYVDALYSYKKVYEAGYQDNANINYRMGVCYLNISGEKQKAIPFLEKAVKNISTDWKEGSFKEESAPVDALLYLGNAYRINKNIEKACYTYNEYINKLETEDEKVQAYAKMQIDACQRARLAYLNPKDVQIENLGTKYNTNLDNFQPVLSADGTKMAFMSEKKFYDAVYFVQKKNGQWLNPINITPQIQSDGNQYVTSLSHDGSKMLLAKVDNFDSDIMISEYSSMHWSKSKNIGKPVNSKYFEYHACLSADGKTLYFTSNRPESIGEMDIFVSHLNEEGTWTEPENIGATINTIFNESSPFISLDGKTLYYSRANHPENIGGEKDDNDIWYSQLNTSTGDWEKSVNLGEPLNNKGANFISSITPDGNAMTVLLGNEYRGKNKMKPGVSVSTKTSEGWSAPQSLDIINAFIESTDGNYFLANNRRVLIMAVDRYDTQGGKDLYVSFLQRDNKWTEPMNLGNDINTASIEYKTGTCDKIHHHVHVYCQHSKKHTGP